MVLAQVFGIVCPVMAMAGAIVSGLVLAMADHNTKWKSTLGRWGAVGVALLLFGMWGWLYSISVA